MSVAGKNRVGIVPVYFKVKCPRQNEILDKFMIITEHIRQGSETTVSDFIMISTVGYKFNSHPVKFCR